jgi:predicted PurR-regulated permease PerM
MTPDFNIEAIVRRLEGSASQGIQILISGLGAIVGAGSQLALVLLFAVLMLASRKHLYRSSKKILKQSMHVEQPQLLEEVVDLFEQFLLARLLIVAIIGGADTIILFAFGIEYAILMGSFLGVMTLIPAVGFIIGVIPPIIVSFALHHSFLETLFMFLALFVMSIIEGNVLTPKMVGKKLNINALSTFVGLFAGGLLWGAWGMFLSIPVLGVLRIIFNAVPSLQPWGDLLAEKDERMKRMLSIKESSKDVA